MQANNNYLYLIQKLDAFIRKFYLNKIIRGILFFLAIAISFYLILSFLEFKFYLSSTIRKLFFYNFILGAAVLFYTTILDPIFRFYRLGKQIDYTTAAKIIGIHFTEVEDKLINILQLKETEISYASQDLIDASIQQKIEKIKPIPFTIAINLNANKKYLKFALPPLAILAFILFAAPNILSESNYRILNNNQYFEKQAPFQFIVENNSLEAEQFQNFELQIKVEGKLLPEKINIETAVGTFSMNKVAINQFTYTFNKIPNDIKFQLQANGFKSQEYILSVIPKPTIVNFIIELNFPDYLNRKNETIENTGDLNVPEGTEVAWTFNTQNTDAIHFSISENKIIADKISNNGFEVKRKFFQNTFYSIKILNDRIKKYDSIQYSLSTISDVYPQINVEQFIDSLDEKLKYFAGEITDDYGLTKLQFYYKVEGVDKNENSFLRSESNQNISFSPRSNESTFNYSIDLNTLNLLPGDKVTYYFEVWDNDGVHGAKSTRSLAQEYFVPTLQEIKEIKEKSNEEIKNSLEKVLDDMKKIESETNKIKEKLVEKKELNWEDKKALENLINQQQNAQQKISDLKNEFEKNISLQKEFLNPNNEILEKQDQLQKMFEELLSDEMKDLYEEIKKLLDELNREQSFEKIEEMQLDNQQLESELDRMLELFKQLELEQKMQESISDLEQLAEKQELEAEKNNDKKQDQPESVENQKDITEEFSEIQKDLDEIQEMNKDLEKQKDLESTENLEKQISQEQENAKKELDQKNAKKAAQNQKSASDKMKEMAAAMKAQMSEMQMKQQDEDINSLRQLLDNLVKLSLDQESLMEEIRAIKVNNPSFVGLMERQQRIKEDNRIVEDSLIELSKRVFQISSIITREMNAVNSNLEKSINQLSDRSINQANLYQQLTMTGYNNLALLLDEVMQQMQKQMSQSMPGSQMCQKPGGESQLPSLSEMQKQLNEQMSKMKGEMSGQNKGNKEGLSKELAEMAAKQAAIREALQKMAQEIGGGSSEDAKLAKQLEQLAQKMDKTEEDIVNKKLTEETLKRQQDILTRLLEATESERQRKIDNERQSNSANEINKTTPPEIEEYLKKRKGELELLKTISPELKLYYKNLVEEYFKSLSTQ